MDTVQRNQAIRDRVAQRSDIKEHGEEAFEESESYFEDRFLEAEETASVERERLEEERERNREANARVRSIMPSHGVRRERDMEALRGAYEQRERGPEPPDFRASGLDPEIATARWRRAHGVTDEEWATLNSVDYISRHDDLSSPRPGMTFNDALDLATDHLTRIRGNADADYVQELQRSRADTKRKF